MQTSAKIIILLLMLPFVWTPSSAQQSDPADSVFCLNSEDSVVTLLSLITPMTPDSLKKIYYYRVGCVSDNYDTATKYASLSLQYCLPTDLPIIADNYYNMGVSYYMQNQTKEALHYFQTSIRLFERLNMTQKMGILYIALGKSYHDLNFIDSALYYLGRGLDVFVAEKDSSNISYAYHAIGEVNVDMAFYETATEYFLKACEIDSLSGDNLEAACAYMELGNIESGRDNYEGAFEFLNRAIRLFETTPTDDQYYIGSVYRAYSLLMKNTLDYAELHNDTAFARPCDYYLKRIGDYCLRSNNVVDLISKFQLHARYLSFLGRDKEAVIQLKECEKYIDEDQSVFLDKQYYELCAKIYKKVGDYKRALEATEMAFSFKERLINDSTMKTVAKFQTEQEIKIHRAEAEAKQRQMRIIIFALIGGLVLVSVIVVMSIMGLKIRRKALERLAEKNQILSQQKTEIEAQRDEILCQKSEIEKQKDIISSQMNQVEAINRKIVNGINYAKRIQTAVISFQSDIDELFPRNFVYFKPRDIVGGDFYRVVRCGKYHVMVVADCTGHGVPGGFLSMLGISALKEFCTSEDDAANPGYVLDRMRDFIETTLTSGPQYTIDDGMDMTICSYDYDTMQMYYATANQTAILVRDGEAATLRGDRMPVGRALNESGNFHTFSQPIEKDDNIYIFSDGIQDQPGGDPSSKYGRKFLLKSLVEFLQEISRESMTKQYELLDEKMTEWRGKRPQVDDMTLIGIRV